MSEETKSILLQVRVDEEAAKKKLVDLGRELENNKRQQQELQKEMKKGGVVTEEQARRQLELKEQYKNLTTDMKANQKALDDQRKADAAKVGSINQLRAQLATLTAAWNDLSEEERENADVGGELQKATKEVSDKLKGLEKSVGDTRRNVGNYSEGLKDAVMESGFLSGITMKVQDAQQKYNAVLTISKAAMGGNVSMLKLLRLALISTGIGAIVVLLGGLVAYLTKTQEGMDKVAQVTKGFTTIIGWLTDKLAAVGKATFEWFSDIESAGDLFTKLGDIIKENLLNRVKAFGVILDAIKSRDFTKLQDGIFQLGTGVENASAKAKAFVNDMKNVAKAAAAIEKENQRIRDAEIALTTEREKANAIIEQQKKIADDTTKSEGERLAAAKKADAELTRITNKQLDLQRRKVANLEAEQALTNNTAEDNKALAEEKAKLFQIEAQNTTRSIELQNKLNSISKEASAKRLQELQKRLAAEAELLEIRTQSELNSEADILELRTQILQKKRQQELAAEDLTQLEIQAIKAKYQQEEAKLRQDFVNEQRQKELEEQERTSKLASETAFKVMQAANTRQDMELKNSRAKGLISAQEYEQKQEQLKVIRMQRELMLLEQYAGKIAGQDEKIAAKRLEISNYLADKQIENQNRVEAQEAERLALREQQLTSELEMTGAFMMEIGEQVGMMLANQGQGMENFMATIATMVVDTIAQVLEAQVAASVGAATIGSLASPESIATFGVAGVAKALALVALIKAASAAAKGAIQKAVQPKQSQFYDGGYTGDGGKYEPAGIVHKGEYVMNHQMVKNNPELVTQLEKMRLRGYAIGGMVGANLPPSTRSYMGGDFNGATMANMIASAVAGEMKKVNIYTKITDISQGQTKQATKNKIINQ